MLHEKGIKKIITGEIGPEAKKALDKYKIQVIMFDEEHMSLSAILKKIS